MEKLEKLFSESHKYVNDYEKEQRGCSLSLDGNAAYFKFIKFTKPQITTKVTVKGDSDCQIRILLIGGGGTATGTTNYGGGGGSGFIEYGTINVFYPTTFQVHVGETGEASSVIYSSVTSVDDTHVLAHPGQDAILTGGRGGNGWSGGGDGCCQGPGYIGARNGGDGDGDGQQGSGTGEKLSSFPMKYFTLTPGDGGQPQPVKDRKGGGGGGGVLVDGFGPLKIIGQGEGYGGGGTYCEGKGCNYNMRKGLPGLILMEIVD